jgi:hypothetical protein
MRFGRLMMGILLLLSMGAGALWAQNGDPGLAGVRDVLAGMNLTEERSMREGEVPPDSRAAALLSALQVDGAPFPCGTPAFTELLRLLPGAPAPRREALLRLLQPPRLTGEREHVTPDGAFRILYTVDATSPDSVPDDDRDEDGVPDVVEGAAGLAMLARSELATRLEWPDPAALGPIEIYLARPSGPDAHLLPLLGAPGETVGSRMVLDPKLLATRRLYPELIHQLAHASQWATSAVEEGWWYEATAEWATLVLSQDLSRSLPWLERRAVVREEGLRSGSLANLRGAVQFVLYLEAQGGTEIVRDVWAELGRTPGPNLLTALDGELVGVTGSGLTEHVRRYHLWNLATGPHDTGRHYRNGSMLPYPDVEEVPARYPLSQAEINRAPRGFGTNVLRFLSSGVKGGFRLSFDGDRSAPWAADVVAVRPGGGFELVPVELDESGRGSVTLPADRYRHLLLVVTNLDPDPDRPGFYAYEVEEVPGWPFRLAGLRAQSDRGQVLLSWTSVEESDLYGWRVLRAAAPDGPFEPLNAVPLPAVGALALPLEYSYLDADTVPGTRYWYRIEAITLQGIPAATDVVSGESLPLRTSPALLSRGAR